MMEYRKYNLETYTLPLWEGDTVYNESVMFVDEREAPLLYYPEKVISVLSCDLKTEYREGVDYEIKDGKICLTENSRIYETTLSEFYPENPEPGKFFETTVPGYKYIMFGEGDFMFKRQVFVTYTHKDNWNGFIPEKSNKFDRFVKKLENGEEVKVLFFGDSITYGANSSGIMGFEPYAESWCQMLTHYMAEKYKNAKVNYINTGLGGMNTRWGLDTVEENVINYSPDLLVLAFGMNDPGLEPCEVAELKKQIMEKVNDACPDCDIAVVATMLPHFRLKGFWGNQEHHEAAFKKIFNESAHLDVIPVTSVHKALLEKKRYYDMSGNNVNHPNDFLARVYAQTLIKVILG